MENSWVNPPGADQADIISLSTGIAVSSDIASDLLQGHDTGEEAYQKFRSDCLERASPTAKFHDKMKKYNLKTFLRHQEKRESNKHRVRRWFRKQIEISLGI